MFRTRHEKASWIFAPGIVIHVISTREKRIGVSNHIIHVGAWWHPTPPTRRNNPENAWWSYTDYAPTDIGRAVILLQYIIIIIIARLSVLTRCQRAISTSRDVCIKSATVTWTRRAYGFLWPDAPPPPQNGLTSGNYSARLPTRYKRNAVGEMRADDAVTARACLRPDSTQDHRPRCTRNRCWKLASRVCLPESRRAIGLAEDRIVRRAAGTCLTTIYFTARRRQHNNTLGLQRIIWFYSKNLRDFYFIAITCTVENSVFFFFFVNLNTSISYFFHFQFSWQTFLQRPCIYVWRRRS